MNSDKKEKLTLLMTLASWFIIGLTWVASSGAAADNDCDPGVMNIRDQHFYLMNSDKEKPTLLMTLASYFIFGLTWVASSGATDAGTLLDGNTCWENNQVVAKFLFFSFLGRLLRLF